MKTPALKNALLAAAFATAGIFAQVPASQAFDLCAAPCGAPPPTVHPPKGKPSKKNPYGPAAMGLLGGVVLGAMIANSGKKSHASAIELHDAYCDAKYKTYNASTKTFMSKSGPKLCKSPYL